MYIKVIRYAYVNEHLCISTLQTIAAKLKLGMKIYNTYIKIATRKKSDRNISCNIYIGC